MPGRDLEPGARDRHGRRRPRHPGRVAEVGGARPAADRPRRSLGRRRQPRAHLPQVPRRPARVRGRRQADARGRDRDDRGAPQRARRARPADRRDRRRRPRDEPIARRRPLRARDRAPTPTPSSAAPSSRTCWTCSTAATPRRSSPSCVRGSSGIGSAGTIRARPGARQLAVTNAGTIPDRGLYAVTLPDGRRVGELDEEMVYEARPGQTFLLGATTWRIEEIGRDRVIVTPAPGLPGRGARSGRATASAARESSARRSERSRAGRSTRSPRSCERDYDLDRARRQEPRRVPARAAGRRRGSCPPTARS